MIEKLKDKIKRIISSDNTVIEPKKNLILIIITACIYFAVLLVIFFYTGDIKYLFVAVLSMIPLIIYAVYSFFKEKRHDKSSEKDKQEFLSGAKYRQKEWKKAYFQYKEEHTFETISKEGMIHDLKKRYRTKNIWIMRLGILLITGSLLILFIPMTKPEEKVGAFFGIVIGGVLFSIGLKYLTGGPVRKFLKQQTDISEIEKSYAKGKMLSFGDNGINIGSSHTVIYNGKCVFAIENNTIKDLTRKMVRVKHYEDNLYSGQEYRYYVRLIYNVSGGETKAIDVRLDEFQCEMMIAEFNRRFYPEREYDSSVLELKENHVSV